MMKKSPSVILSLYLCFSFFCLSCKFKERQSPVLTEKGDAVPMHYSNGLQIIHHALYTEIIVRKPWLGAKASQHYFLVPKNQPIPLYLMGQVIIRTPVNHIALLSATDFPHLDHLNLLDHLVAVGEANYVYNPKIREALANGKVIALASNNQINIERTLELAPDLIISFAVEEKDLNNEKINLAKLPMVLNASYLESHPLGRAEWIKFIAAFFNQEALAESLFVKTARQYEDLAILSRQAKSSPTVFVNALFGGTWHMSGGNSYVAKILNDAGAKYLWAEDSSSEILPLNFESVLDKASAADFWINPSNWNSLNEGLEQDERYNLFKAFRNKNVFNNNARVTPEGGNDIFEEGAADPAALLADMLTIFHPELLPQHSLKWFHKLE